MFATDTTFNELTRKGHTNIASYITGMSLGYLVYRWQKDNVNFEKYKVIRYDKYISFIHWLNLIEYRFVSTPFSWTSLKNEIGFVSTLHACQVAAFVPFIMNKKIMVLVEFSS